MITPSLEGLIKSHKHYLLDYHVHMEGIDLDVEHIPVRNYFIPNKFIPVIFKFKSIKEEHWCFETCVYRGKLSLNGWADREELVEEPKTSLSGNTSFFITAKSKSVLTKAKLFL